ncbi:RagB/SusD family nutrient uptake outer membrane protein [Desertivirga arenae]|uniref:RagB/SusD family nutrient uptake outer membrane protein n=1 Tax=Desertivirga arenae TaxID=2810309 RepID=UPI001A9652CB|nr:RagB/SusD family nutrient uptake outer membrane protein [Pedobacter sp. SYSU D00823]
MNIKVFLPIILAGLFFSSCNKWLDVQPESEISAPILFSTESGFQEALNGVYNRGTQPDLYGKELTVGTPEVLAQNYTLVSADAFDYRQTGLYNYKHQKFIERKDSIWIGLYNAITNCNLILSNIDEKQSIFAGQNYNLIKGESLALRAYLHFDLLRLFAPSFIRNPNATGIPYVNTYSKDVTPMSSVRESLDKIIADLEAAKTLMAADPIRSAAYIINYPTVTDTTKNTEENSPVLFLQNRRHRMNYFAVCGTLARVYLYKNDKTNALNNALAVIQANRFPWTNPSDFNAFDESKKDRILYKELIFSWYIPQMKKEFQDNWFRTGSSGMYIESDPAKTLYETGGVGGNDLRYKQWLSPRSEQGRNPMEIVKYRRNPLSSEESANLHYLVAPAIRLSEMYYIAAECTYSTDPGRAVAYVNQVRTIRGIGEPLQVSSEEQFITELLKECRKEWYAEGQIFYMYKRLNRGIVGQTGVVTPPSDNVFVLPLPNDEILFGGR